MIDLFGRVVRGVGGFSTKLVSVVLCEIQSVMPLDKVGRTHRKVASTSRSRWCRSDDMAFSWAAWFLAASAARLKLSMPGASGKSTQKALMFMPYRKAPKHSLKRFKLSCSNCRCIILASRSAIPSANSPKAGSSASRGRAVSVKALAWVGVVVEARRLVRDGGRSGVVGREGRLLRVREADRAREGGAEVGVVE